MRVCIPLLTLALALAAGGCANTPPASAPVASPSGPVACDPATTATTAIDRGAQMQEGEGWYEVDLEATNTGSAACTLTGLPTLTLIGQVSACAGEPFPCTRGDDEWAARWEVPPGDGTQEPITLAPGGRAHTVLTLVDHPNADAPWTPE